MKSSLPLQADKRNLSRDRIGIVLALIIGIAGQLIVFLIPDPLKILAPQIRMLTDQVVSGNNSSPLHNGMMINEPIIVRPTPKRRVKRSANSVPRNAPMPMLSPTNAGGRPKSRTKNMFTC